MNGFLRGVSNHDEIVAIPGKYVNEVTGGNPSVIYNQPIELQDDNYNAQIVARVGIA